MNHKYLMRLVVLKRRGFQSQKYGMPSYLLYASQTKKISKNARPLLHLSCLP